MIPYLPPDCSDLDVPPFYKCIQENLVVRSAHHESWHTHKRDTSVCWICDLLELSKLLISEMERIISKSSLDLDDQLLAQEIESEGDNRNDEEPCQSTIDCRLLHSNSENDSCKQSTESIEKPDGSLDMPED